MGGKSKPANRNKYWMCPFFKWDGEKDVNCEGGRISFPSRDAANEYMNTFCADNPGWENCTVAKKLYEYYERTEEDYEKR